jgi:hypothetical protein
MTTRTSIDQLPLKYRGLVDATEVVFGGAVSADVGGIGCVGRESRAK